MAQTDIQLTNQIQSSHLDSSQAHSSIYSSFFLREATCVKELLAYDKGINSENVLVTKTRNSEETSGEATCKLAFPYEINWVDENVQKMLLEDFTGERTGFVQVGPKKWFFPSKYLEDGKHFYNFQVRPDDTWIVTFPRSGTTWTQELIWLIANNLDFRTAGEIDLTERFPFLEFSTFIHDKTKAEFLANNSHDASKMKKIEEIATPGWKAVAEMAGPRFIKTHFPFTLLPPNLLNTGCKVIYVARNPKDVVVSFYHLNRLIKTQGYKGDFAQYWEYFVNNLHPWTPYWEHIKEGWEKRHHANVLFMFYEDMIKDSYKCIRRVAHFLGKDLSDTDVQKLTDYLSIQNFSKNDKVNMQCLRELGILNPGEPGFVRRGKIDGWQQEFTPELRKKATEWIDKHLSQTDIVFPS